MKRISSILLSVFSIGMLVCLAAGGLSFVGYIVAIIIGGDTAPAICGFLFKTYIPIVIKVTSAATGIGLIGMYLKKQIALTVTGGNVPQNN